jgi:hypothetical protein
MAKKIMKKMTDGKGDDGEHACQAGDDRRDADELANEVNVVGAEEQLVAGGATIADHVAAAELQPELLESILLISFDHIFGPNFVWLHRYRLIKLI